MSDLKIVEGGGLLTPQQAADYLGIKISTIYAMTMRKTIPFCKIGKFNRFRRSDLDKFIANNMSGISE